MSEMDKEHIKELPLRERFVYLLRHLDESGRADLTDEETAGYEELYKEARLSFAKARSYNICMGLAKREEQELDEEILQWLKEEEGRDG